MLSSRDAASRLGYTVQHVRRLIRGRVLEGEKIGRDWVVSEESVNALLARRANTELPLDESSSSPSTHSHG